MPMLRMAESAKKLLLDRWDANSDQRRATYRAIQAKDSTLANTAKEVKARSQRLKSKGFQGEGIVNTDDSLPLAFLSQGIDRARAVARVVQRPHSPSAIATGFLVTPRLLLTNNHVCPNYSRAEQLGAQFNYTLNINGGIASPDLRLFMPDIFFLTSIELDFSLIAVANSISGRHPGDKYGFLPMIGDKGKAIRGNPLNLIHHPGGEPTSVAIRSNLMVAEDGDWIQYQGDTRRGSSGAPVFNDQWELVALHHGGYEDESSGVPITPDGARWTRTTDEESQQFVKNEGARVSKILAAIRGADIAPKYRRLIAAI